MAITAALILYCMKIVFGGIDAARGDNVLSDYITLEGKKA
jgi:hypothetical protein